MADVFETIGDFVITRLRSEDVPYLAGAVSSEAGGSIPVAIARGPVFDGPGSAVGVGDSWGVAVTMAPTPDVIWVIIEAQVDVLLEALIGNVAAMALITFGNIAQTDETRGPIFDLAPTTRVVPGVGTNFGSVAYSSAAAARSLWMPLDPIPRTQPKNYPGTVEGWTMVLAVVNGAVALAQDDVRVDMTRVVLLGYPVNAWNTGALWEATAFRGS